MLCHYWYFLYKNFSYGPFLLILKILQLFMLKKSVYRIYFLSMSKREVKKLMKNSNIIDEKGVL